MTPGELRDLIADVWGVSLERCLDDAVLDSLNHGVNYRLQMARHLGKRDIDVPDAERDLWVTVGDVFASVLGGP